MRDKKKMIVGCLVAILIVIPAVLYFVTHITELSEVHAYTNGPEFGMTIVPTSPTDFGSTNYQTTIQRLKKDGVNYVDLVIPLQQSSVTSTTIFTTSTTPTDASLISAIQYAHSQGIAVMLIPHVDVTNGIWRANINPADKAAWMSSYGTLLTHYAQLAQQYGVEQISVGAELVDMSTYTSDSGNTQRWINLIQSIRAVYSGKLTYSATRTISYNCGLLCQESLHIGFWPQLDYIGISAYYNFSSSSNSVADLEAQWVQVEPTVRQLADQYNKQVLFTEIGFRSTKNAHYDPAEYAINNGIDLQEQANDYAALFGYWSNISYFKGYGLWDWTTNPNDGGPNDQNYTPENKPTETIMAQYFSSNIPPSPSPSPTPTPTPTPSPNGGPTASPLCSSNTSTLTISWTDPTATSGSHGYNVIISNNGNFSGPRWYKFIPSGARSITVQDFNNFIPTKGASGTLAFTPGTNYMVRIYYSTANQFSPGTSFTLATCQIPPSPSPSSTPSPTPPSSQAILDIWWPANGSTMSGVQPFQTLLENYSLAQYTMYWQVDGGQLNNINDNTQGYPHKQSDVDVTNWKWRGNGPYIVNFIAKDSSGLILSQKSVTIYTY